MNDMFSRTENAIGSEKLQKLKNCSVIVFGVGGVGGFACEALARSGIGRIGIVDKDKVDSSNINRQIIAVSDTVGKSKVDIMQQRINSINPYCKVEKYEMFFLPDSSDSIDFNRYDVVIDAVDTVTAKLLIIEKAKQAGAYVISSMGTGNKFNPSLLRVTDVCKTDVCPLAKVMRRELKKRNITELTAVWSTEKPIKPFVKDNERKQAPASMIFVPSSAGILIAYDCVKYLLGGSFND